MKKNTYLLWLHLVKKDILQILLLSVFFAIITVSSILAYQKVDDYIGIFARAHDYGFNNNTLVFENTDSISMELVHEIEALESVSSLNTLSNEFKYHKPKEAKSDYQFVFFDASRMYQEPEKIYPLKTTTGEIINELKPNEIILGSKASSEYKVGDTISFDLYDFYGMSVSDKYRMNAPIKTIELTVRGFIPDNYKLPVFASSWGYGLADVIQSYNYYSDDVWISDSTGKKVPTYVLLTGKILDREGNEADIYFFDPTRLIIQLKDGYTIDDFFDETRYLIENRVEKVYSYESLANKYLEDYSDGIGSSVNYLIASFILIIVSIVGILVNWYVRRQNELFVYYLLGLKWKACVGITVTPYIISLILGFFGAIGIAYKLPDWMIDKYRIDFNVGLIIFLGMLVIYILCCIPYYLTFLKKKPIEMYQARE